jgi:hypothetical protein
MLTLKQLPVRVKSRIDKYVTGELKSILFWVLFFSAENIQVITLNVRITGE